MLALKHTAHDDSGHLWGPTKSELLTLNVSGWNELCAVLEPNALKLQQEKTTDTNYICSFRVYPYPITVKPLLAVEMTWSIT